MPQSAVATTPLEALYRMKKKRHLRREYVGRCVKFSREIQINKNQEMNPGASEEKCREDHLISKAAEFHVYERTLPFLPGLTEPNTDVLPVSKKSFLPDMVCDLWSVHVKSWRKGSPHCSGVFAAGALEGSPKDREVFSYRGTRSPAWTFFVEVDPVYVEGKEPTFSCEVQAIVQLRTLHQFSLFQGMLHSKYQHKRAVYAHMIREYIPDGLDPRVKADMEILLVTQNKV